MLDKNKIDYSQSLGIQIEDNVIRIVALEKLKRGIQIIDYTENKLKSGAVERGVIKEPKEIIKTLKKAIKNDLPNSKKRNKVICSLPEHKTFIKTLTLPMMKESEITEAIKWEAEDNIPFPMDQVYYDWQILEKVNDNKKLRVMLVVTPKEVIDSRVEIFYKSKLQPIGFWPDSFALKECLGGERGTAIIYFGTEKSIIFVLGSKKQILFSSTMFLNFSDIEKKIVKKFITENINFKDRDQQQITKETLENVKKYGLDVKSKEGKKNYAAVKRLMKELVKEIKNALEYSKKEQLIIQEICLTGIGSMTPGFDTLLSMEVNREIKNEQELRECEIIHDEMTMPKKLMGKYVISLGCGIAGA
jgi:type IV pilus assembly protein PilM